MAFKFFQTRSDTIQQQQTRWPNGKMFGHQTFPVWTGLNQIGCKHLVMERRKKAEAKTRANHKLRIHPHQHHTPECYNDVALHTIFQSLELFFSLEMVSVSFANSENLLALLTVIRRDTRKGLSVLPMALSSANSVSSLL